MYVAGGGLPDGDYCCFFNCVIFQAQKANGAPAGPPRLGVQVDAYPLSDPKPESMKQQFYSMGTNADKSFAPNPVTGKGIVPIPGAQGGTLNDSSNWAFFLKSLYDSGLPGGVFTNDLSALDGIWVHVQSVPEPEQRKAFRATAATGEADQPQSRGTIAVVTEIKDEGKPWEGTGGVPDHAQAAPAPPKVNGGIKQPAKVTPPARNIAPPARTAAPAPAAAVSQAMDQVDLQEAANAGISAVLEKNLNGCTKLMLRTGTFGAVKAATKNDDLASAIVDTYFSGTPAADEALTILLNTLGYTLSGGAIKPNA